MAQGSSEGMGIGDERFRKLFDREAMLASDWYAERLRVKQERDIALWKRHVASLEHFRSSEPAGRAGDLDLGERFQYAQNELARVSSAGYLSELRGTIGADPFAGQLSHAHAAS
jgi:hypothetical protein